MRPIIIVIIIVCVGLFLLFSTPLFFESSKYGSVTLYFNQYNAKTTDSGISPKYPVDTISINLMDPFHYSDAQIKIKAPNFHSSIDIANFSEVQIGNYMNSTYPEYALKSEIFTSQGESPEGMIYNNTVPIWAEISCVEPMSVKVNPFFTQTSINTWEGSLFFDTWNGSFNLNPVVYTQGPLIKITANKLIITTIIPDSYDIEPSNKLKLEKIPNNYLITSELEPGESLDIKVTQKSFYEPIIIGVTFFCPLILGLILGPMVDKKLKERKPKQLDPQTRDSDLNRGRHRPKL